MIDRLIHGKWTWCRNEIMIPCFTTLTRWTRNVILIGKLDKYVFLLVIWSLQFAFVWIFLFFDTRFTTQLVTKVLMDSFLYSHSVPWYFLYSLIKALYSKNISMSRYLQKEQSFLGKTCEAFISRVFSMCKPSIWFAENVSMPEKFSELGFRRPKKFLVL